MPKAAMTVLLDDAGQRVLMIWRHRFAPDRWNWELTSDYVDSNEVPALTAVREGEEGDRPAAPQHAAAEPVSTAGRHR